MITKAGGGDDEGRVSLENMVFIAINNELIVKKRSISNEFSGLYALDFMNFFRLRKRPIDVKKPLTQTLK